MLRIIEQSTNRLVIRKTAQILLLTILSGLISGFLLILGIANSFSVTLGLMMAIFALIGGISVLFPLKTTCVLDKYLDQLTITTEFLFFRRIRYHRLQEIVLVKIGLLAEALPRALAQKHSSFSTRQFLFFKFASGEILLLKAIDLQRFDDLQYYQQVAEQIYSFLNT